MRAGPARPLMPPIAVTDAASRILILSGERMRVLDGFFRETEELQRLVMEIAPRF